MGGAQPLAVTMNGGVVICADVDPTRLDRRLETRYLDVIAADIDEAIGLARQAQAEPHGPDRSAWWPTPSSCSRPSWTRDEAVDVVTDQTPAHDPLMYVPLALSVAEADELRRADPAEYLRRARDTIARHVTAMLALLDRGAEVFDYGNSLRAEARLGRCRAGLSTTRASSRPTSARCSARARGRSGGSALSGDPADIGATDRAVLEEFPDNEPLARLDPHGVRPGGLPGPAGPDLLAGPGRAGPDGRPVQRHGRVRPAGRRRS